MLNENIKRIASVFLPEGTQRRKAVQNIYHFFFAPYDWSIRSDLPMHICIWSRMLLKKLRVSSPGMKRYQKLYKRHDGDRCFIVCTGPSLTIDDLDMLKNEITFGVNSIFMAYSKTSWRPTYYIAVDYFHLSDMIERETAAHECLCSEEAFIHPRIKLKAKKQTIVPCMINYTNHKKKRMENKSYKLSANADVCVYDCFSVTNAAIQLAVYMGFKEIYIIGADCSYSEPQMHFIETEIDENDRNADWLPDAVRLSIEGYTAAKAFTEKLGVKVYNATRGGKLEVFERVNFDSIDLK